MTDNQIEQEIQAKGLTAPRVTPADIEANIASEHYFTAADGFRLHWLTDDHPAQDTRTSVYSIAQNVNVRSYASTSASIDAAADTPPALGLLIFCVLVLRNGFTVTGESACASPENFDAEVGCKIARANAINKVWPLMGYELRSNLWREQMQREWAAEQKSVGGCSMKLYIGTKQVIATPMTRLAYNKYRGWTVPADENGADAGYLVEYLDGGTPNHPSHDGYTSWSPKAQFDNAYRPVTGMSFGLAIEALKAGKRVARAGWNGKGMWLAMQPCSVITPEQARGGAAKGRADEGADSISILAHIDMRAADGSIVVGWLASQTDMLSDDWRIVE